MSAQYEATRNPAKCKITFLSPSIEQKIFDMRHFVDRENLGIKAIAEMIPDQQINDVSFARTFIISPVDVEFLYLIFDLSIFQQMIILRDRHVQLMHMIRVFAPIFV